MPLTNTARDVIADAVIGGTGFNKFTAANAHIGVGNGTTVFAATQTDLTGASKFRKIVSSAPVRTANTVRFISSFADGEANFAWNEWGIFNAATGGQMLSRKVVSLGTKTTGVWELTIDLTFTV